VGTTLVSVRVGGGGSGAGRPPARTGELGRGGTNSRRGATGDVAAAEEDGAEDDGSAAGLGDCRALPRWVVPWV
jgi:hypothetical protein